MNVKKKYLFITLEYPPTVGGIATYVDSLAEAFGSDHAIILAPPHKDAILWDSNRPFLVIRSRLLFPRYLWPRWLRMLPKILSITGSKPVGRVFVHHVLPIGYVALLLKWFWKIPFVVFYHGTDVQRALSSWRKHRLLGWVAKRGEINVFDSEFLRRKFIHAFPELADQSIVLSPCPDPLFLLPPSSDTLDDLRDRYALRGKKVILSVGRFVDGKGFPHVLRVFSKLLETIPNAVWVVVGDGPKREILVKKAEEMSIQHAVRFVGKIPHKELPAFYGIADLFLLLTHPDEGYEEGFGLIFLEAAAAGVPVVAGRSGGVEEAVIHNETGFVVDAHMDKEIVNACLTLLTNPTEAERMKRRAYERIISDFQWSNRVAQLGQWLE